MNSNDITKGSINTSERTKRGFAKKSLMFNLQNEEFVRIFKSRFEKLGIDEEKARENFDREDLNGTQSESEGASGGIGEDEAKKSLFFMGSIIAVILGYIVLKLVFSK